MSFVRLLVASVVGALVVDAAAVSVAVAILDEVNLPSVLVGVAAIWAVGAYLALRNSVLKIASYFWARDKVRSAATKNMRIKGYPRDYAAIDFAGYYGELMRDPDAPEAVKIDASIAAGAANGMRQVSLVSGILAEAGLDRAIIKYTE